MARDDTRRARSARRARQAVHLADRDRTAEHWNKNGSSAREGAGCPGRVFVGSLKTLSPFFTFSQSETGRRGSFARRSWPGLDQRDDRLHQVEIAARRKADEPLAHLRSPVREGEHAKIIAGKELAAAHDPDAEAARRRLARSFACLDLDRIAKDKAAAVQLLEEEHAGDRALLAQDDGPFDELRQGQRR